MKRNSPRRLPRETRPQEIRISRPEGGGTLPPDLSNPRACPTGFAAGPPGRLRGLLGVLLLVTAAWPAATTQAAELEASDAERSDHFGSSVAVWGDWFIVGANEDDGRPGSTTNAAGAFYLFNNLDAASGTVTESLKLYTKFPAASQLVGDSVSLYGTTALVGGPTSSTTSAGRVFVYRNLNNAVSTSIQDLVLMASDYSNAGGFGRAVSLSGGTALVGAGYTNVDTEAGEVVDAGAAYLFRDVNTVTSAQSDYRIYESAKLIASDGVLNDHFGNSVSVSGALGVVAARDSDIRGANSGAAYFYKNLDTITGTVTEYAKFAASDAAAYNYFGGSVSVEGNMALISAEGAGPSPSAGANKILEGRVYVYRNLDAITEGSTVTESFRLAAIDTVTGSSGGKLGEGSVSTGSGTSVSLSGTSALVGAPGYTIASSLTTWGTITVGAAYLYQDLDQAVDGSTVYQTVKITASNISRESDGSDFGNSVSLNGDRFIIGAEYQAVGTDTWVGRAYSGTVSSMTTLDEGNASRAIDGISFDSRTDWIIGEATDSNLVALTEGDSAKVTLAGMAIYVGKTVSSDNNTLIIEGTLKANDIYIGSIDGNSGNTLRLEDTAAFTVGAFHLADWSMLSLEGDYRSIDSLLGYLGSASLQVWTDGFWNSVSSANYESLITSSFEGGYTNIMAASVPEPGRLMLLGAGLVALLFRRRRERGPAHSCRA